MRERERLRLVGLVRVRRGLAGLERERDAIHAVAQPGRLGPVLEDMPEMPAAASAMHLGAAHEKAAVGLGLDPFSRGAQKLGHPVPLLNLVPASNSGWPQAAQ